MDRRIERNGLTMGSRFSLVRTPVNPLPTSASPTPWTRAGRRGSDDLLEGRLGPERPWYGWGWSDPLDGRGDGHGDSPRGPVRPVRGPQGAAGGPKALS